MLAKDTGAEWMPIGETRTKGHGRRHIAVFYRYLRKMERESMERVIVRIVGSLTEQEAHDEEVRSIKDIGRRKLGRGPLLNLTGGGEGSSGWIPSKKWRETHSKALSGSNNPCFGKTGSEHPHFGKKHTDEYKARMREISRKRANRPSVKARQRKRMLGNGNPAKRPEVQKVMRNAGGRHVPSAHINDGRPLRRSFATALRCSSPDSI
jgi:hypothetical protein